MKNNNIHRTFESFVSAGEASPSPTTKPTTRPTTKPGTRPNRQSPIRRHKPAVDPKPKAELDDLINLFTLTASDEQKKQLEDKYADR